MTTVVTIDQQPIALPFTNVELTEAIINLPSTFGQMEAEGFFPPEGLDTNVVSIDIEDGVLSALPVTDPEGPSTIGRKDAGRELIFRIPNVSHLQGIMASDIRGILNRAIGGRGPRTMETETNKWLMRLRRKFDLTLEVMRITALKGIVLDGALNEIVNLYTAFNITPLTVFFDLSNPASNIRGKCQQVRQAIEENLSDEVMTGVEARVSAAFFDALTAHPNVEKYWLNSENAQALANQATRKDRQYTPRWFEFGNITFVEYNPIVPLWQVGPTRMITAGLGHAYPSGTLDSHKTYVAPPIDIRALNGDAASEDDLIHVTQELLRHGTGIELKGQMNVLPMWRRPKTLVTLSIAAS